MWDMSLTSFERRLSEEPIGALAQLQLNTDWNSPMNFH